MQLTVNGQARELVDGSSVADLLTAMGFHPQRVAVERNLSLVPRARFAQTVLQEGDRLEVVTLVGGG